jgi:hypothetical protein
MTTQQINLDIAYQILSDFANSGGFWRGFDVIFGSENV